MACALPQNYDISYVAKYDLSSPSSLTREFFNHFSAQKFYRARVRRLPFEAGISSDLALQKEHDQTLSFEKMQLKADPRLKPEDLEVDLSHLNECTSCRQREASHGLQHGVEGRPIVLGSGWQLLVDDYAVYSWRNVLRFLNPPESQQIAHKPRRDAHGPTASEQTRFGCPCTVLRTASGFRLYHAAGSIAGNQSRYKEWPGEYLTATSDNGTVWTASQPVTIDGFSFGALTGSFSVAFDARDALALSINKKPRFVAGYEGANSRVCLAHSRDGKHWSTARTGPIVTFSKKHTDVLRRFQRIMDGGDPWSQSGTGQRRPAHLTRELSVFIGRPRDGIRKHVRSRVCSPDVKA